MSISKTMPDRICTIYLHNTKASSFKLQVVQASHWTINRYRQVPKDRPGNYGANLQRLMTLDLDE